MEGNIMQGRIVQGNIMGREGSALGPGGMPREPGRGPRSVPVRASVPPGVYKLYISYV